MAAAQAACLSMVGDTRRLHTAACTPPTSRSRDARIAHRCRIAERPSAHSLRFSKTSGLLSPHDRSAAARTVLYSGLQVWYRDAVAYKQTSAPSSPPSIPRATSSLYAPAQKWARCIVHTRLPRSYQWHIPASDGVHGSMQCLVAVAVDKRCLMMEHMMLPE